MRKIVVLLGSLLCVAAICIAQDVKPADTQEFEPAPPVVKPGENTAPPSDAIVLFGGADLSQWQDRKGNPPRWEVKDGVVTVMKKTGPMITKQSFGDCQLHIEWRTPTEITGDGQSRGNSGIFLANRYEVQVLDSYENSTYVNGQAGAIYKQHIPLVNACRQPGEWQAFDIVYIAPRFQEDGSLLTPGYFTVFHNGVLIQNHVELKGSTANIGKPSWEKHEIKQPISLQDHGNPVSYRNIWIRELP
jgi:hypothetical protein